MSAADQQQVADAVTRAKAPGDKLLGERYSFSSDWSAVLHSLNRLAMPDMLPALDALHWRDRNWIFNVEEVNHAVGPASIKRIKSAVFIVEHREIADHGLPDDQVNDGRVFLGCTRLDDAGVQQIINEAIGKGTVAGEGTPCCGAVSFAWLKVLVPRRQAPGGSRISNLAAAAHYMLSRYHVCAAQAFQSHMKTVVHGYDERKRRLIAGGDKEMKAIAITGNPPFPPDFAIRNWANKGADDGEADRMRCNSQETRPPVPIVNNSEF